MEQTDTSVVVIAEAAEQVRAAFPPDELVGRGKDYPVEAREMSVGQPGRLSTFEPPPKPTKSETSWRSSVYVTGRHSADGNDYVKGDPIPYAEAVRQGLVPNEGPRNVEEPPRTTKDRVTCPRCDGLGKSKKMAKRHGPTIGHCPACRACQLCGGSGTTTREEAAAYGTRQDDAHRPSGG